MQLGCWRCHDPIHDPQISLLTPSFFSSSHVIANCTPAPPAFTKRTLLFLQTVQFQSSLPLRYQHQNPAQNSLSYTATTETIASQRPPAHPRLSYSAPATMPLCHIVTIAPPTLLLATLAILVILSQKLSLTVRRSPRDVSAVHLSSASVAQEVPADVRGGTNLVYWTPHKTGSTSMRWWLKDVAREIGAELIGMRFLYPYSRTMDHEQRANFLLDGTTCAFVMGHIRVPSFLKRFDERRLGAVVTTTRATFPTLASKFFHRTDGELSVRALRAFAFIRSTRASTWFYHWHDSNPCEPLEYYDGLKDCRLDGGAVEERARGIAERIDCVVDTDDPEEDVRALCRQMGLSSSNCPRYADRNVAQGRSLYDDLYNISHVRQALGNNFYVTDVLRSQLMMKRCRFFASGNLSSTLGPARWPTVSCKSQTISN